MRLRHASLSFGALCKSAHCSTLAAFCECTRCASCDEACDAQEQADDVDDLVTMLASVVDPAIIQVGVIGPVVASHGGPGVIGLCFTLRP